jgi:hypothetical protein
MKAYLLLPDYILWVAIVGLQWCLLVLAIRHGIGRVAPRYVIFIGFLSVQSTLLFLVSRYLTYSAYVWAFYLGMGIETLLLVLVLYDIFRSVFDPLGSLPPKIVAKIASQVVAIAAAALTLAIWKPAVSPDAVLSFLRTFHRSAEFIATLSLWSVVLYARALGIPWRSRVAGLASGFLLYLTVQSLITAAIGLNPGRAVISWLSRTGIISYVVSLVIWILAVRRQEAVVQLPTPAALGKLRVLISEARSDSGKLTVQSKTKWSEQ